MVARDGDDRDRGRRERHAARAGAKPGPQQQRQEQIVDRVAAPHAEARDREHDGDDERRARDDLPVEPRLAIPGEHQRAEHRDPGGVGEEEGHERDLDLVIRDEAARPQRECADRAADERRGEAGAEEEDHHVARAVERMPRARETPQHRDRDQRLQDRADARCRYWRAHTSTASCAGSRQQRKAVEELADEHRRQDRAVPRMNVAATAMPAGG